MGMGTRHPITGGCGGRGPWWDAAEHRSCCLVPGDIPPPEPALMLSRLPPAPSSQFLSARPGHPRLLAVLSVDILPPDKNAQSTLGVTDKAIPLCAMSVS